MSQKIDFTTLGFGNYSTSEVNTGFTWLDGKTIYKKTMSITLPNNTQGIYAHNISNFGRLVKAELSWYDTEDSKWYYAPRVDSGSILVGEPQANTTNIYVKGVGAGWNSRTSNAYVTLYYTKSS